MMWPGLIERRRTTQGALPSARDMGRAIVQAALDPALPDGATVVIGASLESMLAPGNG